MKYKCVNELDKFMFQDAEVKKMEFNPGLMTMVLLGVAARHNNPSNDTLVVVIWMTQRFVSNHR